MARTARDQTGHKGMAGAGQTAAGRHRSAVAQGGNEGEGAAFSTPGGKHRATTADGPFIPVEVAYATPQRQLLIPLEVSVGTTALEAVRQSGILREFPQIDPENDPMGIFSSQLNGKDWPLPGDYRLQENDRVEIYRPLLVDPRQARLARAGKKA